MKIEIGTSPKGRNGGHRKQANGLGNNHYFTGVPCNRGHLVDRITKSGKCCECSRIKSMLRSREYRKKHPIKAKKIARETMSKWRGENPHKVADSIARRNKEKMRKTARIRYQELKKKFAKKSKIYRAKNKEYFAVAARNRRCVKLSRGKHTLDEVLHLLNTQKWKCVYCKKSLKDGYHADHIVSIKNGGSNLIDNIQCLCPPCNLSKNSRDAKEWAEEKGYA